MRKPKPSPLLRALVSRCMAQDEAPQPLARAAGVAFMAPDGRCLFVRRAMDSDHGGTWCFPGGGIEGDETPDAAARREALEELRALPYGEMSPMAETEMDGVHYTTFRQPITRTFTPALNGENTEHAWAPLSEPPEPLHPGVKALLTRIAMDRALVEHRPAGLAFDRATVRSIDQDGRMQVSVTNISKANVCPYLGSEIPDAEALGLDPKKVYQLLRDPEELAKAADTFNRIPVLSKHVPVFADDHKPEYVVGATGSDAEFVAPYLRNSLVIWAADAIDGIESGKQRELSCAYRYVADMTPGVFEGVPYDGVMRDLRGNHVALVEAGRAGPDVIVGDQQLERKEALMSKPLTRRATLAKGALLGLVKPILAADAKLDFDALLAGVTAANWLQKKPAIVAAIKPKLAADADIGDVVKLLDGLDNADADVDDSLVDDADPVEDLLTMLRGKVSDEDLAAFADKLKAMLTPATDADPGANPPADPPADPAGTGGMPAAGADPLQKKEPATAMDAKTVNTIVSTAVEAARKQAREAAEAREVVRPYVGTVSVALDSGEAIYKAALDSLGVKTEGIHPSALRAVLEAQPKPGEHVPKRIAQDEAPDADFLKRFPGVAALAH